MAVALVQSIAGTSAASSTSVAATLGAAPTAGNFLIAAAGIDGASGTITAPSGFTTILSHSSTSISTWVGYKISTGTETTITVSHATSSAAGSTLWYGEYNDTAVGTWGIVASATNPTNETANLSWSTGTTGAATGPGYAVAFHTIDSGSSKTGGGTYTNTYSVVRTFASATRGDVAVGSLASVAAGATTTTTFSYTGTADQMSGAVVVFRKAAPSRATTWRVTVAAAATRATTWTTRGTVTASRSSSWQVRTLTTSARLTTWRVSSLALPSIPNLRLRAYSPNGGDLGMLPTPQSFTASYVLDDVGGLTVEYSPRAPRADILGQPCEIAVEISPDSGRTWVEPINSRFVYVADGIDPLNRTATYSIEGRSYIWRLSKAVVVGGTITGEDENAGKRPFLSSTPGKILKTLLGEAQTRGALTGIDHSSFTSTVDSAGQAWANTLTIYYEPGINLLTILQDLTNQGFVNFRTQGRDLQVYNADTVMAVDRTIGTDMVTFRPGRDLTEAPFRRTWEALADTAFFAGAEGKGYTYTNPAAIKPWGRQEIFISNGSVTDAGTMATLTQAELSLNDTERIEYTRGLDFAEATVLPLLGYSLGDYIWSTTDNTVAPARLRIRQLTLVRNDRGAVSGSVVLNDRFVEADLRQKRRIEGISNGGSGVAGDGSGGTGTTDKVAPPKVTGLVATSAYYMALGGYPQSAVTLTWGSVAASDLDHYEVFARPYGSATTDSDMIGTSADTRHTEEGYVPDSQWWFSVVAVDQSGNRGVASDELGVTMAKKTAPPQPPSTPSATAKLGMVSMFWDGLPSIGSWPLDFLYVRVHCSTVNDFTPTTANVISRLYSTGTVPVVDQAFGVPLFFKLVAVDTSGLESLPSQQASATPTRLVGTDLDTTAITFAQIPFKDVGNFIFDGSFEDATFRTDTAARSAAAWTFTTADKYHGAYSATINAATNPSTSRTLIVMSATDVQQMRATEKILCRFAYKGSAGADGSMRLVAEWTLSTGGTSTTTLAAVTINNTWQQIAQQLTAPTNTVTVRIYMELTSAATSGTWYVDAVEVRRTVGTAIIEDAAIQNAQISALAVNTAKIADLDVGKLTGGSLTADVLLAGKIQTASSGSRLEMTGTGMRLYSGATLTGHWDPSVGQLRIYNSTDASHTSSGHGLQFGDSTGQNLIIDNNEIMSRFNGSFGQLLLNREGGELLIGGIQGGFAVDGSDFGVIPQTDDHNIQLRGYVMIANNSDADYADETTPFMVGVPGGLHIFMDSNEIAAVNGDAPSTLYINGPRNVADASGNTHHNDYVTLASNSMGFRRGGSYTGGDRYGFIVGYDSASDVGVRFEGSIFSVRDDTNVSLRSVLASAFNTTSGVSNKKDVTDFDPLPVVKAAKSQKWKYKPDVAKDDEWHYGPMVENLPAEMRRIVGKIGEGEGSYEVEGYDLAAAVGVLWEAVRVLANRLPGPPS